MDLILRRPLRKQRASKDAPEYACGNRLRHWIVLRGPFGAPQDEGGGLLKTDAHARQLRTLPRKLCMSKTRYQPKSRTDIASTTTVDIAAASG